MSAEMHCEEASDLANALRNAFALELDAQTLDASIEGEQKRAEAYWERPGEQ